MPFIQYATFTVHGLNHDCSGTWKDCRVSYVPSFLIIRPRDEAESIIIPVQHVLVANGVEAH